MCVNERVTDPDFLWAEKLIRRVDPGFKHRWIAYGKVLSSYIDSTTVWVDCGCGKNRDIQSYGHRARIAVGVDIGAPGHREAVFIQSSIASLPFSDNSIDLVTLRFVVEHFPEANPYLSEIARILKPGGKILVQTTNIRSPVVFGPKLLIPYRIRSAIMARLFKVSDRDIFPAFHRVNTLEKLSCAHASLHLLRGEYQSDLNFTRKGMFLVLLLWHCLTMPCFFRRYRTNIMVLLEKRGT